MSSQLDTTHTQETHRIDYRSRARQTEPDEKRAPANMKTYIYYDKRNYMHKLKILFFFSFRFADRRSPFAADWTLFVGSQQIINIKITK